MLLKQKKRSMSASTAVATGFQDASQNLSFTLENMYLGNDSVNFPDEIWDFYKCNCRLATTHQLYTIHISTPLARPRKPPPTTILTISQAHQYAVRT
eukprot:898152-Pleurochrysis_carterae.AAC.2